METLTISHAAYGEELSFYHHVQLGNEAETARLCSARPISVIAQNNPLSDNPVHSAQYHLTVTIALVTRFCIEGGMPQDSAFSLSDMYILRLDKARTLQELDALHKQACSDFVARMHNIHQSRKSTETSAFTPYSPIVCRCIDFLAAHLHEPITLADAAAAADVHPKYLNTLFKQNTGQTVFAYLRQLRITEACDLLAQSDMPYADIAARLCFSSQSHFCAVFRSIIAISPAKYRRNYYQSHWH